MSSNDTRWIQRFSNFKKAFIKLEEAVKTIEKDYAQNEVGQVSAESFLDEIIKDGVIQRFKYTHELAWNVIKDYLAEVGGIKVYGSKDASREAFANNLIVDGDIWMEMIKSRNLTTHTYNEDTADEIFQNILNDFYPAFFAFEKTMAKIANDKV